MAQFNKDFVQDLQQDIKIRQCGTIVFNADNLSNVITVELYDGQEPATLGGTVVGAVIRSNGTTVPISNGTISGNTVSMTLTEACFTIPGQIGVGIQIANGDVKTTVFKAVYNVEKFTTDEVVDPSGEITLEVSDLIDAIETAVASIPADYSDLMAAVAPTFSTSTAYTTGQFVWYSGALYRFTADHAAGSWNASQVAAAVVANDLAGDVSDLKSQIGAGTLDGIKLFSTATSVTKTGTSTNTVYTITGLQIIMFDQAGSNRAVISGNYTLEHNTILAFSTSQNSYVKPDFSTAGAGAQIYLYKMTSHVYSKDYYIYAGNWTGALWSADNFLEDKLIETELSATFGSITNDGINCLAQATDVVKKGTTFTVGGLSGVLFDRTGSNRQLASADYTLASGDVLVFSTSSDSYTKPDFTAAGAGTNIYLYKVTRTTIPANAYVFAFSFNGWLYSYQNVLQNSALKLDAPDNYHFENDLNSEGVQSLNDYGFTITKNGTASLANYGQSGAVYKVGLPSYKKAHLYFEYRWDSIIPYSTTMIPLGKLYGTHVRAMYCPFQSLYQSGIIARYNHYRIGRYGDNNLDFTGYPTGYLENQYKDLAFVIRYTGAVSSTSGYVTMDFGTTSITFTKGGNTIGSVSFAATDTVASLAENIGALTDFTCTVINADNHTCAELLPVAVPMNPSSNLLGATYTDENGNTKYENLDVIVPYAFDHKWHTVEMIADPDNNKCAIAVDGLTNYVDMISGSRIDSLLYAEIGGASMTVRNLVLDFGHFGDAEIVESIVPPYEANSKYQLVSNHNPRILIWEGHGIESGDELTVSTERLYYLFDYLSQKGYVPITWEQFRDWVLSDDILRLPKRCYLTMFDDYEYNNYLTLKNRRPFNKFNVAAGLAVVSSNMENDDTIEANGKTYTVSDVWDMIVRAGWYPCSHTSAHRNNEKYSMAELVDLLQGDVLSCDEHHIHSDIMVYPFGAGNAKVYNAMAESDFKLGVRIATNNYNCRANSPYMATRVNLEDYITLEQLKAPIV